MFDLSVLFSMICMAIIIMILNHRLHRLIDKVAEHELFIDGMFALYGEKINEDMNKHIKKKIKTLKDLKKKDLI